MKKFLIRILLLSFGGLFLLINNVHGQQDPQFSMYMFNILTVNPGYTGTRDALSMTLLNRNQWIGYPGAPVTQSFSVHSPLFENIGVGINVINDKIGPLKNTAAFANLSYRIRFRKSNLSVGIKAGGDVINVDLNSLTTSQQNDPVFSVNTSTGILPNFGTGLYYYSDRFYLGVSIPRSLNNKFWEIKNQNTVRVSKQQMHYYFIGGCVLTLNEYLKFKPSFQTKFTAGAPLQMDMNGSFIYKEKLYLGAFYRLKDAIGFIVQMNFTEQLRAALAWDQTISSLRGYNNGSLELSVSYDFIFKKNNIKSPRYF